MDSEDFILDGNEVLVLIKGVDGKGSGLDADRIDSLDSTQLILGADDILANLKAVDGTGSGLDADRLDGLDSSELIVDGPEALALLKQVDGAGSGLDADRLDGIDSSVFLRLDDQDLAIKLIDAIEAADGPGSGLDADKIDGLEATKFMRADQDTGSTGQITATGGLIIPDGQKIAVGINNPSAAVHVKGTIKADIVQTDVLKADILQLTPLNEAPAPAAAGMVYFDSLSKGLKYFDGQKWVVVGEKVANSCKQILEMSPDAVSGEYTIDFDGPAGPMDAIEVFCDMDSAGGGWTRITLCIAKDLLKGELVAEDGASIEAIDNSCRPYTRDGAGDHTYHYTFQVPGGFKEFFLDDYLQKAYAKSPHTSEIHTTFKQTEWTKAFLEGGRGDISFGTADQLGPVASYAKFLAENKSCTSCTTAFPKNGQIFDLGDTFDTFRIGWGEAGPQHEGWYPWWSGYIMIR